MGIEVWFEMWDWVSGCDWLFGYWVLDLRYLVLLGWGG